MRLEAFRVQNYKRIRDTGWVSARDVTVLVGKNEAGKSAVLRGLSKLNPSDGAGYDGLREFPRRRFTTEFDAQDWPVASARFALAAEEQQELEAMAPSLGGASTATITRRYSGRLFVTFDTPTPPAQPTRQQLRDAAQETRSEIAALTAPEGKGGELGALKEAVLAAVDAALPEGDDLASDAECAALLDGILALTNESWERSLVEPTLTHIRDVRDGVAANAGRAEARKWATDHMPQFIYFDRYDVLDSAIHIPSFIARRQGDPHGPRVRITECLFKHVGLDLDVLAQLGRHAPGSEEDEAVRKQIDERSIRASSASAAMTAMFTDWWDQRRHVFRYQPDGDYFRVWVSDDLDPSEIELDQRSHGMQYFFSFYLVFQVEAGEEHANSILLLDEPGVVLHGTAQEKVVKFLHKISADNQVVYTTHSPFLIDVDHLEEVRVVFEDTTDGTTKVTDDVWPPDADALFPLQAGLGYQLIQATFFGPRQLIVEGITDMWLVKVLSRAVAESGREGLRDDLVVVPCAGTSKLLPLASLLLGNEIEVAALLDGDEPGRREGKKLVDRLLRDEQGCLFVGDFVDGIPEAEVEDLFPADAILAATKQTHPGVNLAFNADEKQIQAIVPRLKALFARREETLDKWRIAEYLRDALISGDVVLDDAHLDRASELFQRVNGLFSAPETEPEN